MRAIRSAYHLFSPTGRERLKLFFNAHGHAVSGLDRWKARDYAVGKKRLDRTAKALAGVMAKAGIRSLHNLSCLEFGAGYVPTEALIFHLLGAKRAVAVDYNAIGQLDSLILAAKSADRLAVIEYLAPFAKNIDVEKRLDRIIRADTKSAERYIREHIEYIAPCDLSEVPLSSEFEFIHSLSVFEHLPVSTANAVLKNLALCLAPGGKMITEIDLSDHRNPRRAPLAFLSTRDNYNPATDFDRRGNRLRHKTWRQMLENLDNVLTHSLYRENARSSMLPSDYSRAEFGDDFEDLLITRVGFASTRLR